MRLEAHFIPMIDFECCEQRHFQRQITLQVSQGAPASQFIHQCPRSQNETLSYCTNRTLLEISGVQTVVCGEEMKRGRGGGGWCEDKFLPNSL